MTDKENHNTHNNQLLQRAEEMIRREKILQQEDAAQYSPQKVQEILHTLRVHQIELEMQNEELRRAQVEIDISRARYFDLYNLAPVGYSTLNTQGLILEVNLTAAAMLGMTRDELVMQPITRFILKEDQDIYYLYKKLLLETKEKKSCELRVIKKDGTVLWIHMEAAATQDSTDINYELPLIDTTGSIIFRVAMSDISERKAAEILNAKLEAQLQQAQRIESVGRLAGGVAHDFNNMLGVILGHADLAMRHPDLSPSLRTDLEAIRKTAERSAHLTRKLLAFARKQTIAPKVINLNETVSSMIQMIKRLIGEDINLSWLPYEELWPVKFDPSQVDQILANLCINARDAISGVGRITIETKNITLDAAYCAAHAECIPGQFVQLTVRDSGCGIDKETLPHLFEPFFTTKETGKGTGLGLATVYGTVKQNNGFIDVSSEKGQDTVFTIYLPRHAGEIEPAHIEKTVKPIQRGHETILLVEDEPAILEVTTRMLQIQGYTVLAAGTPAKAIQIAGEQPGGINLLMTDVVMPEMNGRDLAKILLNLYPHLKRLFMSGYTANIIAQSGVLDDGIHFLQKPYSMKELAAKVREALDNE